MPHRPSGHGRWTDALERLRGFRDSGLPEPGPDHVEDDGFALGRWLSEAKRAWADGLLPDVRVEELKIAGAREPDSFEIWQSDRWHAALARLSRFLDRFGSEPVPGARDPDGFKLGDWLELQKASWRRGTLPSDRANALTDLGIEPRAESPDEGWNRHLAAAAEVLRTTGTSPGAHHVSPDGFHLGSWLRHQLTAWRRGEIPPAHSEALREAGFKPEAPRRARQDWFVAFASYRDFRAVAGKDPDPEHVTEGGFALGAWIERQKAAVRRAKLSPDRLAALQELGIDLDIEPSQAGDEEVRAGGGQPKSGRLDLGRRDAWLAKVERLKKFRGTHGRDPKSGERSPDGIDIGTWLGQQRHAWKKGKLTPEQVKALEDAGTAASRQGDAKWFENLERLKAFREAHGKDPDVSYREEDGFLLGQWATQQRSAWRQGSLADARREALAAIGVKAEARKKRGGAWESHLAAAAEYRRAHAADPPSDHVTAGGFRLGAWLVVQRSLWRSGSLPKQKVSSLRSAGFTKTDARKRATVEWRTGLAKVGMFRGLHGRNPEPHERLDDGTPVGEWLERQTADFRAGLLDPGREAAMGAIGVGKAPVAAPVAPRREAYSPPRDATYELRPVEVATSGKKVLGPADRHPGTRAVPAHEIVVSGGVLGHVVKAADDRYMLIAPALQRDVTTHRSLAAVDARLTASVAYFLKGRASGPSPDPEA